MRTSSRFHSIHSSSWSNRFSHSSVIWATSPNSKPMSSRICNAVAHRQDVKHCRSEGKRTGRAEPDGAASTGTGKMEEMLDVVWTISGQ